MFGSVVVSITAAAAVPSGPVPAGSHRSSPAWRGSPSSPWRGAAAAPFAAGHSAGPGSAGWRHRDARGVGRLLELARRSVAGLLHPVRVDPKGTSIVPALPRSPPFGTPAPMLTFPLSASQVLRCSLLPASCSSAAVSSATTALGCAAPAASVQRATETGGPGRVRRGAAASGAVSGNRANWLVIDWVSDVSSVVEKALVVTVWSAEMREWG